MQRLTVPARRLQLLLALACAARTASALAHGATIGQLGWNWEGWVLASLAVAVFGYVRGLLRMDTGARARVFGVGRYAAFAAGMFSRSTRQPAHRTDRGRRRGRHRRGA